ncbi:MAG: sigma-70 family RNA polymerase sigma factor [Polyangiaceae bacterium]|nr:sigma-70 family RNA polymerase sigma factor [Polyangiaceae bacterium]
MTPAERVHWEKLVRDLSRLRAQIRSLGVPAADVDDVLQEVLIRVAQALPKYTGAVSIGAYAFGFAVFVSRNWMRRRASRGKAMDALRREPAAPAAPQPDALAERSEAIRLVHAALAQLSFNHRVVLVAVDLEEMQIATLARVMGVPEATLRTRHKQARLQFAAALERIKTEKH